MRSINDARVLRGLIGAFARGPFFTDRELRRLFGLERDKAATIAETLPAAKPLTEDVFLAIDGEPPCLPIWLRAHRVPVAVRHQSGNQKQ